MENVSVMFAVVAMILAFVIGWQLSRKFTLMQMNRQDNKTETKRMSKKDVDENTAKIAQEAMSLAWWSVVEYLPEGIEPAHKIEFTTTEAGKWMARFFTEINNYGRKHHVYVGDFTVADGMQYITHEAPKNVLEPRQRRGKKQLPAPQMPDYLPDGNNY